MIIGIISYLPDNEQTRQKRITAHKKQLDLLLQLGCNIYIVAQNYKKQDFIINPNIWYFPFEKGIGPSQARNILLKYFYNTNEDWMLMCDDDAYYYNYYDIDVFFDELKTNPEKFKQLDFIRGKFASKIPFKKTIYGEQLNRKYYLFRDENSVGSIAMCILKNFNKYYNKQFYLEDSDVCKGEGYEDRNFCCDLKLNDIKTHVLQTFIMTTYNYTDNSTLFSTYEDRMKVHNSNSDNSFDKYKDTDFYLNGKMNPKYRCSQVVIQRPKEMIISGNLIPDFGSSDDKLF